VKKAAVAVLVDVAKFIAPTVARKIRLCRSCSKKLYGMNTRKIDGLKSQHKGFTTESQGLQRNLTDLDLWVLSASVMKNCFRLSPKFKFTGYAYFRKDAVI
jgi:hypothetical protein